ncbi:MAG: HAMP domain-containing sensor histidine kinase [Acidimicrobiales bacterium]
MRRRLFAITLATTTLVVVAFAVPLAGLVRSVARDRAISGAERDVAALAPALALTEDPTLLETAIGRTSTGADGRLTVWMPDGTQLGDQTTGDQDTVGVTRQRQAAFSHERDGGLDLYSPVVTGAEDVSVIRARLPDELLEDGVTRAWAALAGVAVALVAAAAFLADRLARSLTRDATALAGTAQTLAAGEGDARVEPGGTPELAEAARALNLLADRIDVLRSAERERVADLSHQLRTPLTALRLDAEAVDDPDLIADVDRLEAAVTDLIHAARQPLHRTGSVEADRCDLVAAVEERARFWAALAEDDQRQWQLDLPAQRPVAVPLGAADLEAAIDALLGNVFAHTPDGTGYALSVTVDGDTARLGVDDAGHGIAEPDAVSARGRTSARSSGLGLDIARRAAESAGGKLTISRSSLGGARIALDLPTLPSGALGDPGR